LIKGIEMTDGRTAELEIHSQGRRSKDPKMSKKTGREELTRDVTWISQ